MYNFLLGHKTQGFNETTAEILFSVAKTGELLLLLCPKQEIFEKFKCCSLLLFSLPSEGRKTVVTADAYQQCLTAPNYIICKQSFV